MKASTNDVAIATCTASRGGEVVVDDVEVVVRAGAASVVVTWVVGGGAIVVPGCGGTLPMLMTRTNPARSTATNALVATMRPRRWPDLGERPRRNHREQPGIVECTRRLLLDDRNMWGAHDIEGPAPSC